MSNNLVTHLDGMTADWFTALLQQSGALTGSKVSSVALKPFGSGVMTNMVQATLRYDGGSGPSSVLVKYASDDAGNFGIAQVMGLYELEVYFYRDIAARLAGMSIPKCHAAEIDEQSGRFILVLEDRSADTQPGTHMTTVSVPQCAAVMRELALFQAPLWNSSLLQEVDWLKDPRRTLGIFDSMSAGLAPFLARFGHKLQADHVKLFETVLPLAGQWVRSWKAPSVLQHGEFRSGNVLYGAAATAPPVTIIDFQTVRVGPPGVDPAYFMGGSMPAADRRAMEVEVIKGYHQHLLANGVKNFTWDDCWQSYRDGAMYGVYLLVGMAGMVEPSERNDAVILSLVQQFATMAVDLESPKAAGLV